MARKRTWAAALAVVIVATASTALFARAEDSASSFEGADINVGTSRASESARGMLISQNHRLLITSLGESLAYIADKQNLVSALGTQARAIAEKETSAIDTVTEAIQKASTRGTVTRFVFGGDVDHLALVKEELDSLRSTLAGLKEMREMTEDETDRAILSTQIRSIEKHYAILERFVHRHEGLSGLLKKPSYVAEPQQNAKSGNLSKRSVE